MVAVDHLRRVPVSWTLNRGALWDATPRTSRFFRENEEDDQPVEDVREAVELAAAAIAGEEWKRLPVGALVKPAPPRATDWVPQDDRCHWCNIQMVKITGAGQAPKNGKTREHIIPRSFDGGDHPENLKYACYQCNQKRTTDLTWVPWSEHKGDRGLMSASQVFAFQKMGKLK
jgi:hypothetical protein